MAKTSKYAPLAQEILNLVGGKENVSHLVHCITRLRFTLKDQGLADSKALERTDGVVGVQFQNGQLQVIIGQHVGQVYEELIALTGLNAQKGLGENLDSPKGKLTPKRVLDNMLTAVSGSITPLISAFIGAGMLKVVLTLLGPSVTGVLTDGSMTYQFLTFVSDAAFYFLPVFVGGMAARKFNTNEALGMLMGAMLVHPAFLALTGSGDALSIFGLPVTNAGYTSTILPVIMVVWVMSYVHKFFVKISPDMLASIIAPLGTLLVMIPVAFCAVAPLGIILGNYITTFLLWIYNTTGVFGIAIITAVFPFLVMAGMHSLLVPTLLMMISTFGYDLLVIYPSLVSNVAIGAATLAVALRVKNNKTRSEAAATAVTAIVAGVTEPALFGYLLRYKRPLIGMVAGGFAGGLVGGILNVKSYSFLSTGGVFGLPAFIDDGSNLMFAVIGVVVSIVVSFTVAYLVGIKEEV